MEFSKAKGNRKIYGFSWLQTSSLISLEALFHLPVVIIISRVLPMFPQLPFFGIFCLASMEESSCLDSRYNSLAAAEKSTLFSDLIGICGEIRSSRIVLQLIYLGFFAIEN